MGRAFKFDNEPCKCCIMNIVDCKEKTMYYRNKAINCVKDTVLPIMAKQFEECGCSLDEQYKKYGNTEYFFAEIIQPEHIYEIGYPKCFCPDVLCGKNKEVSICECSRQSIIYVLENLIPNKKFTVETIETVLNGAEKCRFFFFLE